MMVVRSCTDVCLLARSQAEGARRHRPRHPKDGGGQDLRGLHAHHREVHQAKKTNRGGGPEALSRTDALHLGHRRRAPCPLEAARRERRGDPRASLRAVGGRRGNEGLGVHHEPRGAQAGLDVQKKSLGACERDEEARGAWREQVRALDPRRLVFVDECSTNIALTRLYARAPRGERAYGKAAMSVEGATDGAAFETYVKHFLAPTLRRGQIVVMDNLQVHKIKRVRDLVEGAGAEVLFLPPYSPDFSPIEEAFSKVKGILRRIGARTREALLEATSEALDAVSRTDAVGWFGHCGYHVTPHLL